MLWPKLKRQSSRTLPFRTSKRRRKDRTDSLSAAASADAAAASSGPSTTAASASPAAQKSKGKERARPTLFSLPAELRHSIYAYVFEDGTAVDVGLLQDTQQAWVHLASPPPGLPRLFPRRLVQIPEALRDEALGAAFRAAAFRVERAEHIALLYGAIGDVGLANLRTLELDWVATRDVLRLLGAGSLDDEDEEMENALGLLPHFEGLRKLKVTFNGFAFMVAYARFRHRRLKAPPPLQPRLDMERPKTPTNDQPRVEVRMKGKHPLLCENGPVYTSPELEQEQQESSLVAATALDNSTRSKIEFWGNTIKHMHVRINDDIYAGNAIFGFAESHLHRVWMWKVDASGLWAYPLRKEIAQRDPLLVKLRESICGLEELELCSPDGLGETFLLDFVFWMIEGLGTHALVDFDFLSDGLCIGRAHVKAGLRAGE